MRQTTLLSLLGILLAAGLAAQTRIDRLYTEMPYALDPVLSRQQRAELPEYVKADMGDSIANRFGNQAHMTLLDTVSGHLVVHNTASSTLELKLLSLKGDTAVAVIRTVCLPACHSVIRFYDTHWAERTDLHCHLPHATDWLDTTRIAAAGEDPANLLPLLADNFISLTFDSATGRLLATCHTPATLSEEDRNRLTPYLMEGTKEVAVIQRHKGRRLQKR